MSIIKDLCISMSIKYFFVSKYNEVVLVNFLNYVLPGILHRKVSFLMNTSTFYLVVSSFFITVYSNLFSSFVFLLNTVFTSSKI